MRKRTKRTLKIILVLASFFSVSSLLAGMTKVGSGSAPYSSFNEGDRGLSKLKNTLHNEGYNSKTIISSIRVLGRMNKTGVLLIVGPTTPYGSQEVVHLLLDFIRRGGSVLIADDFGRANSLLKEIWNLANLATEYQIEILFNTTSVLCDAASYEHSPARPVITNFGGGIPLSEGVNEVQTSFPTTFTIKSNGTTTYLPMGFLRSTDKSWLESDLASARKGNAEPDPNEWGGVHFSLGISLSLGQGKLLMLSDPDILSNALIKNEKDNKIFSKNIISWLASTTSSDLVIFDESHHSFLPYDPFFGLNLWFSTLTLVSSSWIIAPLIPLLTFIFIARYLPRREKFRARTLRHKRRKATGTSLFESKVEGYMGTKDYTSAASTLLNRLLRKFSNRYSLQLEGTEDLLEELPKVRSDLATKDLTSIRELLQSLKQIAEGERPSEEKFQSLVKKYMNVKDLLF